MESIASPETQARAAERTATGSLSEDGHWHHSWELSTATATAFEYAAISEAAIVILSMHLSSSKF